MTNEYKLTDQELIERCEEIRTSHISIYQWPDIQELLRRFKQRTTTKLPSTTNELLPCPFCGSDELQFEKSRMGDTITLSHKSRIPCSVELYDIDRDVLVSRWNTRTTANPLTVESELRIVLSQYCKHHSHCDASKVFNQGICTCGLDDALNKPNSTLTVESVVEAVRKEAKLANSYYYEINWNNLRTALQKLFNK